MFDDETRDHSSPDGTTAALSADVVTAEGDTSSEGVVIDEITGEPVITEPVLEGKKDNAESSRLGRKVGELERKLEASLNRIEQLMLAKETRADEGTQLDPDRFLTVKDLQEYEENKGRENRRLEKLYENTYVASIGDQSSDLYDEVRKELLTNTAEYPTHTDFKDPARDAAINFKLAEANLIKAKYGTPESRANVKGGTGKATGVATTTRQAAVVKKPIVLDDVSDKFAKAMGMTEERIANALKDEE